jgi:hypothetical protein
MNAGRADVKSASSLGSDILEKAFPFLTFIELLLSYFEGCSSVILN